MTGISVRVQVPVAALFATTLFVSAFLLFWIQPLFGKMVLPLLGGAPNVWITAVLFFQIALLAGYAYAHFVVRLPSPRAQMLLHIGVLGAGFLSLPVAVSSSTEATDWPVVWLIGMAAVSIGWPFVAVSATAPLVQKWFASAGHARAFDPYFLYAASNLGSITALLAFPILLEPFLRLGEQSGSWTAGYGLLVAMTLFCGLCTIRAGQSEGATPAALPATEFAAVTWRQRLLWIALAFAPSSLMLGVTTHITTDVASAPLLWVIPLTLYLLTFVIAFAREPILRHDLMVRLQPFILIPLLLAQVTQNHWPIFGAGLVILFVTALVCHGELVRRRPSTAHLTEFYLLMSVGGLLGGVFNSVVAPVAFDRVYEYGIALVIACMLRPGPYGGSVRTRLLDVVLPALLFAAIVAARKIIGIAAPAHPALLQLVCFGIAVIVAFGFKERPLRFALGIGAVIGGMISAADSRALEHHRSFFGAYSIVRDKDRTVHILKHGTTIHGAQKASAPDRNEPLTYYTREGPVGQVFAKLDPTGKLQTVGAVGLGLGTAVCYRHPGQRWSLFEIDPLVIRLARDERYFRYMADCFDTATMDIVPGDARLSLEAQPGSAFDLLLLDAFSSDAVPVHLLTREAFTLYRSRLKPGGLILLNVSNRYLDLVSIVERAIGDLGLHGLVQRHSPAEKKPYHAASVWMLIARSPADLSLFHGDGRWKRVSGAATAPLWTDDFSNILGAVKPLRGFFGLAEP